jgi:C-terminal processing protease CtpA/Prc
MVVAVLGIALVVAGVVVLGALTGVASVVLVAFFSGAISARFLLVLILSLGPAAGVSRLPRLHSFQAPAPSRVSRTQHALTPRTLSNLVAFTRLLGYVRYFYPGDAASATDWDQFAVRTVESVEGDPDAATLAQHLAQLFAPAAPTVRVFVTGQLPSPPALKRTRAIVQWVYMAFGTEFAQQRRVRAAIIGRRIPAGFHDPERPYLADLGGGVSALIPLAVYADRRGTLPHTRAPVLPTSGNTRQALYLADVAIAWSMIQHFYTYFDTADTAWAQTLRIALREAGAEQDDAAFLKTLKRLLARLDDGHAFVWHPDYPVGTYVLPLGWDWIQGHLVVVNVARAQAGAVQVGDAVTRIDGRPVAALVAAPENVIGGTPAFRRYAALLLYAFGQQGSAVELTIQPHSGAPFTITLHRQRQEMLPIEPRPARAVETLAPGIMYLDLTRITTATFNQALPALAAARGLVVDARGYPTLAALVEVLGHLSAQPLRTAPLLVPIVTYPDHQQIMYHDGSWAFPVHKPTLKAKLVFLINSNGTVSRAETLLGVVEAYHLGALVGSHTAGTNGDSANGQLPGGFGISWTGIKVTKHDGSPLMHVGILPTVSVERTVQGVIDGRDELLDRGVEELRKALAGAR